MDVEKSLYCLINKEEVTSLIKSTCIEINSTVRQHATLTAIIISRLTVTIYETKLIKPLRIKQEHLLKINRPNITKPKINKTKTT